MSKTVRYLQFSNPAALPPLEHSALIFQRDGYNVALAGIVEPDDLSKITPHPALSTRADLWQAHPVGWRRKRQYLSYVLRNFWRAIWAPRGWTYASDLFSCPLVCLIKWFKLGRVIYHEHDSPETGHVPRRWTDRLLLAARRQTACVADLVLLPNRERAAVFDQMRPGLPSARIVWNCPRLEEVSAPRSAWNGRVLRVLYQGSIVPERMPVAVMDAVAQFAGQVSLSIVGYFPPGCGEYKELLKSHAHGLGSSVHFTGTMSRAEMFQFAASHDVGLAFMPANARDINMRHMTGASNKAFDYLAVGVALLMGDKPEDWRACYVDGGYGLSCDPHDATSIAAAFQRFIDDPSAMRAMGESGRRRILTDWNYENQFAPVLREVQRLTNT